MELLDEGTVIKKQSKGIERMICTKYPYPEGIATT